MIHLDANFLIASLREGTREQAELLAWLAAGDPFTIATVAWAEFLCGPLSNQDETAAHTLVPAPEPLLPVDAELAARLFNQTGRRSRSVADCMIAATAIGCGARLATLNRGDFEPFLPFGLKLL